MIGFEATDDQKMVKGSVAQFAARTLRPRMREFEKARAVPDDVRQAAHGMGITLASFPEEVGGGGLGVVAQTLIEEELAYGDPAAAFAMGGPGAYGWAALIFGGARSASALLAPFLTEAGHSLFGAVAWGEKKPGERPGLTTRAQRTDAGWRLSGEKAYVLHADRAQSFIVFAQVDASKGWEGLGAFVVPREARGLRVLPRETTLGLDAGSFGGIALENVDVPEDARLGHVEVPRVVAFFAIHGLAVAARSVGLARAAFDVTRDYVEERKAFGKPIGHFQAVAFTLADRAMDVEAARSMVWRAAWLWDEALKARGRGSADELGRLASHGVGGLLREGSGHARRRRRRAAPRGRRLHARLSGREVDARCQADAALRDDRRASRSARGVAGPRLAHRSGARPPERRLAERICMTTRPRLAGTRSNPEGPMAIEFELTSRQRDVTAMIHQFAKTVVRPEALRWDREHGIPEDFLRRMVVMSRSMGGGIAMGPTHTRTPDTPREEDAAKRKKRQVALTTILVAEELAWGDAGLLLSMPGPGLGGPPVRASGTPEQKKRFLSIFDDMSQTLRWGAYALTEPGAGSDVAAIRTSCRKDGKHWVLNGRKCYITNGARASWSVVFATLDESVGRAGHRAFVVEKGTPGFSVGRIEDKMMGLRFAKPGTA